LRYKRLHDAGYTFTESATIGSLTHRQVKMLDLAEAVEGDIKRRQREQQSNPESQSHEHYDAVDSRRDAFDDLG